MIYTRPHHEKKVADGLLEKQIEAYLPTSKTLRQWSNKKKVIDMPLFPSYVFVYVRQMEEYYAGLNPGGALYYVKFGKQLARISDTIINNLKILTSKVGDAEVSSNYFTQGQTLLIKEGPLSGLQCEVVQHKNKEKLLVRVDLLNRCVLVDMQTQSLTLPE